jgi:hypothetical protein
MFFEAGMRGTGVENIPTVLILLNKERSTERTNIKRKERESPPK